MAHQATCRRESIVDGLSFQLDSFRRLREEGVEDLMIPHWIEAGVHKDRMPLEIDWPAYYELEAMGRFRAYSLRKNGIVIGYNLFIVHKHMRYRTVQAINDAIYVDPEERGFAGLILIRRAERDLFDSGVDVIQYHSKDHVILGRHERHGTLGTVLDALGYGRVESVHMKMRGD